MRTPVRNRQTSVVVVFNGLQNFADTNATSAARLFGGNANTVTKVDLSRTRRVRLTANRRSNAGAAGYYIELKYHTSYSASVGSYAQIGASAVSVACPTGDLYYDSGWVETVSGARSDVYIALIGAGGDGVQDPNFAMITAEFIT